MTTHKFTDAELRQLMLDAIGLFISRRVTSDMTDEQAGEMAASDMLERLSSPKSRGRPEERSLLDVFLSLAGIPEPRPTSEKERRAAGTRWWQPIRRMAEMANGESQGIMQECFDRMRRDGLTVSAPQSVEQVFVAIYGEKHAINSNGSGGYSQPGNGVSAEGMAVARRLGGMG